MRGRVRLDDDCLLALMLDPCVGKVGIDAPFGWPMAFIDAITTYRDRADWLPLSPNELRFRATDVSVAAETGKDPMSVATSDLAWPAMRCAKLLSATGEHPLDRSGQGRYAEVYPAAALRRWGLVDSSSGSYKGTKPDRRPRRLEILETLLENLGQSLMVDESTFETYVTSDDALDALLCAIVARCLQVEGACDAVPVGLHWAAVREGWIRLPTADSLSRLVAG